jgi:hypothetical protein
MHVSRRFEVFRFNVKAFVGHDAFVVRCLNHLQGGHLGQRVGECPLRLFSCYRQSNTLERRVTAVLHVFYRRMGAGEQKFIDNL